LISKRYADERRKRIDSRRATHDCPCGEPVARDTIYLCAVDKDRNCVSLIQSIYDSFGSRHVAGELGFMLQNRGTSFALDEKHANALQPHKRPFHTIIPSFVTMAGRPHFVFGVMGGDMQPQGQVQVLVNHLDFGMDIQAAGDAPRMMHSGSATPTGKPADGCGHVSAEARIAQSVLDDLRSRGHRIDYGGKNGGGYQGILLDGDTLQGASESRRDGRAVGY
jgi:gamma-glutamyltranspeptidase/glutathione hydrolase